LSVLLALVGPTAAGKSRMGIEVALELGRCEIVSCDSMAVYKRLDIAADKPSMDERRGVPHHMIDVVEPSEAFTAVQYRELARKVIGDIHVRSRVPMLVGGSGLYFRALVDELEFAPSDARVRTRLEASEPSMLWERLRQADPESAARIDPRNVRRVVRAVEILELTGRPPTEFRTSWGNYGGPYALTPAGLTWPREELFRRAAERVRREVDAGLVEEVRRAGTISRTAWQALGVKEIVEHLSGRVTLEEAIELNVRHTKNFIRKQLQWFGADPRVQWVDAGTLGWEGARQSIVARFREALDAARRQ
jgi:tRNA dimethylallyltransferase